ncbi:MAG TPA: hypothetical protein VK709_19640 [Candidatus Saccharimonadales bacterium]|jgi:hypothetical protein|nr:hypothetical protein [Candidatus Saccharimonadales bacterium]
MLLALNSNKTLARFFLLISVLSVFGLAEAAQQPTKLRAVAVARQIILPPKVVAGAPAMLAVLDSRGRLMPKVEVELSNGQIVTTDITGRALFTAPTQPGPLVAKIESRAITFSTSVISPENIRPREFAGTVAISSYPHVLTLQDRFVLEGSGFRSEADSNHISLNGDSCLVIASSPVSLVVLPGPRGLIGDAQLKVVAGGIDAGSFPVSVVALEFSGPSNAVNAGSTGKLILRARGTTLPLIVEVRNGSPGVIRLSRGNVQRLKTSGGEENIATIDVNFVTDGNYSVTARLISADTRRN